MSRNISSGQHLVLSQIEDQFRKENWLCEQDGQITRFTKPLDPLTIEKIRDIFANGRTRLPSKR